MLLRGDPAFARFAVRRKSWDVKIMLSVVCVLVASFFVAATFPARRAASINPADTLRAE